MSFASYTDFGASLAGWLLDSDSATSTDIGVSLVSDLITVGESRIFREARNVDMETSFGDTITAGLLALPASYLALKSAYVDTSPQQSLERRPAEWIRMTYPQTSSSGIPKFIARYGQNFIFGPYPDSAYTVNGIYYKRPTAISGSALNTLFVNQPDLYLYACLSQAAIVTGANPKIPLWEAAYLKILAAVNGADRAEDSSGSTLQMRPAKTASYRARW